MNQFTNENGEFSGEEEEGKQKDLCPEKLGDRDKGKDGIHAFTRESITLGGQWKHQWLAAHVNSCLQPA
jgi:hypothetical protein